VETSAADWQWSVAVDPVAPPNSKEQPRAFLWIPPDCQQVRAVVFGQNNMIEEGILEHREFRRQLTRLGMAELYVAPTFDTWQNATNNDATNQKFNALLKALAAESGYAELELAPIIPMGHSAMASFPWNFAAWNPERTLAILSIHGDAPRTPLVGNGRPNVAWGARNIDGIPGLMVMGEYEWLEERLSPAFKFRAENPGAAIAMLAEPGRGHFDYSDALVRYLAKFVRKAAAARLPDLKTKRSDAENAENRGEDFEKNTRRWSATVALKPVDPRAGWLVDRWRKDEKPHAKVPEFARYSGDKGEAFWAFDREMARLTETFNASQCCKVPQMLGFVQAGKIVPQTPNSHAQVQLAVPPLGDSLTFKLTGVFLEAVAAGGNPVRWTGLTNGAPLGHASGGGLVRLSRISGPVAQVSAEEFAVRFNRSAMPGDRRAGDLWLLAEHPGDAKYKSAVQQALLKIPVPLTEGAAQRITFPEIAAVRLGTKLVKLNATADSGAPVYYYVREGPAQVEGDTLRFTKLPPRAKFPVKVTVVAWQWGRTIEPRLRSAEPVERTFSILK